MNRDKNYPELRHTNEDRDRTLKDDLGETIDKENLKYNPDSQSYEIDVNSTDPDYDHPDPYDTAAPNGEDDNSTWDEANPYDARDEYDPKRSLETDADKLGMHIDDGRILEVDPIDESLARTPEDDRDDLDEEGYPKNDGEFLR
ncbi:hypothetical protein C8P68_101423 [Mucilaginibacter yixingensis]|uniref:Uncharacterized protein n=1 Tax=Mucilaginibacter yixingensis TaxID=1295612 RepID=A0A2T5JFK2_9SPHI|nr:hypothetical protein [Mucilaginibacter yixingensis]PTR01189.1 hypothetical protein C8P68_101423 [Mucilaginibacter yixingensis]